MSSVIYNQAAILAINSLRGSIANQNETKNRITTGLKVGSAKDNAAYYSISKRMQSDASIYSALAEGMTLTENTLSTARLAADKLNQEFQKFAETTVFFKDSLVNFDQKTAENYKRQIDTLVSNVNTITASASFAGINLLALDQPNFSYATGKGENGIISERVITDKPTKNRIGDPGLSPLRYVSDIHIDYSDNIFATNRTDPNDPSTGDLKIGSTPHLGYSFYSIGGAMKWLLDMKENFGTAAFTQEHWENITDDFLQFSQYAIEDTLGKMIDFDLRLNTLAEAKANLTALHTHLNSGVSEMIDANMEEEAAKLKASEVRNQLCLQAISIANRQFENIITLFQQ